MKTSDYMLLTNAQSCFAMLGSARVYVKECSRYATIQEKEAWIKRQATLEKMLEEIKEEIEKIKTL